MTSAKSQQTTTETTTPTGNTYDKYTSKNPIERYLVNGFFDSLAGLLPGKQPENILEVGAGEGEVADFIKNIYPKANYIALDLPDTAIGNEWETRSIDGLFADMRDLPFPAKSFDLVLAIEVFEHVEQPARCLTELKRVGSGSYICSVPREPIWRAANMARGKYLTSLGNTPGHINHWSTKSFTKFMNNELSVKKVLKPFPWTMISASNL